MRKFYVPVQVFACKSLSSLKVTAMLLCLLCAGGMVQAQSGIYESYAILSINGGTNAYYDMSAATPNPDFQGTNLGNFTIGTNTLVLRGGQNKVYKCNSDDITTSSTRYRIYKTGTTPIAPFVITNHTYIGDPGGAGAGCVNQTWETTAANVNVLDKLGPGNYTIEVFAAADFSVSGTPTGTHYANNSANNYKATFTVLSPSGLPVVVTSTGGTALASYATLKAAFDAVNAGTHTGVIAISIDGNTTETASAILNASGSGAASYTSMSIQPTNGAARTITGAITGVMMDLNGADNVTIDGLNTGGNTLTLSNTTVGTSAVTIRLTNDATGNTIRNSTILGANTNTTSFATIVLGDAATSGTGNDNNIISGNNIGPVGSSTPTIAIFSNGSGADNSGIQILNNNIYDYYSATVSSAGIRVNSGFTNGANNWTVSGNRFYQTATRTATTGATHMAIHIPAGSGFAITNNIIGYASNTATGVTTYAGAFSNRFIGIDLETVGTTTNSIQGNTIAGISLTTTSGASTTYGIFSGIYVTTPAAATTNIGTVTANLIGSLTGTGSITVTGSTQGGVVSAINMSGAATTSVFNVSNNNIGSITALGSVAAAGQLFRGIIAGSTGAFNLYSNTIGGTTAGSITSGSNTITGTINAIGIYSSSTGAVVIGGLGLGNIVQNLTALSSSTSSVTSGIYSIAGTTSSLTIGYNSINSLTTGSSTTSYAGTLYGIYNTATVSGTLSILNNTIQNSSALYTTGTITLLHLNSSSLTENVSNNTINNIGRNTALTSSATFTGYYNNGSGIAVRNFTGNSFSNIVAGSATSASLFYGFYSTTASGATININNNSFTSISNGTGVSYALYATYGSVTCNNNVVNNLSGAGIVSGLYLGASNTPSVTASQNTINTISTIGSSVVSALSINGGTTVTINRNKFYDISASGATSVVYGAQVVTAPTNLIFINNIIGDLRNTAVSAASVSVAALASTATTATTTEKIYYNTFYINGTSSGANFSSAAVFHTTSTTSTTAQLDMRNNILVNNAVPKGTGVAAAYLRSSATLANYSTSSNNNLFFSQSGTLYNDATTSYTTLASYKALMATRDQLSISENPSFLSTTGSSANYLHLNPATVTQIESGGSPVSGITDDFDGETRNASTPDIGADEFTGSSPAPAITLNSFVATPSGQPGATTQCAASARNISVNVTTPSGTITSVTLNYTFNGTAQAPITMTASGSTYTATIPAATPVNATVTWNIVAINSINISTTYTGSSYADAPLTGFIVTANTNPSTVCAGSPTILSGVVASTVPAPTYTAPPAVTNPTSDEDLGNVTLSKGATTILNNTTTRNSLTGTIGLATGTAGSYADFTGFGPYTLQSGEVYSFSVSTLQNVTAYGNAIGVYIDYNRNGIFTDAGEQIYLSAATTSGAHTETGSFTVPATAALGVMRMRVICNEGLVTGPTMTVGYGEYEEYLINMTGNGSFTFSWLQGATTVANTNPASITPGASGSYVLVATQNGCSVSSAPVNVTVSPAPMVPAASNSSQCGTQVPTASVSDPNGFTAPTFKWYASSSLPTPLQTSTSTTYTTAISATTTFYVSVTNPTTLCESGRTPVVVTVTSPDAITANANGSTTPSSICPNATVNLSVSKAGTTNTYTYTWTASPVAGSGIPSTVTGASPIITPTQAGTYTYTVNAVDGNCITTASVTITVNAPPAISIATATPATICNGGNISLTAASNIIGPGTKTIGSGASTSTSYDGIFYHLFGGQKTQFLVRASELTAAGIAPGNLTSLAINMGSVAASTSYAGFAVNIATTSNTDMSAGTNTTASFSQVFTSAAYTPTTGANTFTFSTPFTWNGTSNIIIQFCWSNANSGGSNSFAKVDAPGFVSCAYRANDSQTPTALCAQTTTLGTNSNRPQFTFAGQVSNNVTGSLNWTWSNGASTVLTTPTGTVIANNPGASPLSVTYTVTATDPVTTCSASLSATPVVVNPTPTSPVGTNSSQCGTQVPTASVSDPNGISGAIFTWYTAATGAANTQSSASTTYGTAISATTTFYVSVKNPITGCESGRTPVTVTVTVPDPVTALINGSTTPAGVCPNTAITLFATKTGTTNTYTYVWTGSPQANSGLPVGGTAGQSISVTPTTSGTFTYTVTATDGGCVAVSTVTITMKPLPTIISATATPSPVCPGAPVTLTATTNAIGAGTATSGTGTTTTTLTVISPFGQGYEAIHTQYLLLASDLTSANLVAGNITSLSFNVSSKLSTLPFTNYSVKMAATAATSLTALLTPSFTNVYSNSSLTTVAGQNLLNFGTPFNWNGTSNILVDVCFANDPTSAGIFYSSTDAVTVTTKSYNAVFGSYQDNANICGSTGSAGSAANVNLPNMILGGQVATVGAGTYNWVWNPGNLTGNTVTVNPTITTLYTVTATDPATTCVNTASVTATVTQLPVAPTAQPTALVLTPTSSSAINGTFTLPSPTATGYLVVRTATNTAPAVTNNTVYPLGANAIGFIESNTAANSFTSSSLVPNTTYYYWVYAFNQNTCGGPIYQLNNPLTANATTQGCPVPGIYSVGTTGDYQTLTAVANTLAACPLTGAYTFELLDSYTGAGETYPIVFPNLSGSSATNTVTIRQRAGNTPNISSNNATGTFSLAGVDYLIIDGRQGGTGTVKSLVIENTSATGYAVQLSNDATFNTIRYSNVKSVNTTATSGTIVFAGAPSGTSGNDNNLVDNNDIIDGATTPLNAVYSAGTSSTIDNSANTISNNNIANYFGAATASNGVFLSSNNSAWTITGNRFYQAAPRVATTGTVQRAIQVQSAGSGGYVISNNTIGFASAAGTGTTTYSGSSVRFNAIDINAANTPVSEIQGNTITSISLASSSGSTTAISPVFGGIIMEAGSYNVGTVTGNIIGAATGTGSISITGSTTGYYVEGIYANSTGTVQLLNNTVGSLTATGATAGIGIEFTAIWAAGTAGNFTINNNLVGSLTTAGSITIGTDLFTTASSTNQEAIGIQCDATGTVIVGAAGAGNTVQNIAARTSGSAGFRGYLHGGASTSASYQYNKLANISLGWTTTASSGTFYGMYNATTVAGALSITNNNIQDNSLNTSGTVYGIYSSSSTLVANIQGNTINNFGRVAANSGTLYSLYLSGTTTSTNSISGNTLTNVTSGSGTLYGTYNSTGIPMVFNNNISGFTGSGNVSGVYISSGSAGSIYNNQVNNVNSTGTSPAVYGIQLVGGTNLMVYKNTVSNVATTGGTGAATVYGISSVGPVTPSIYQNNVYNLSASTTGTVQVIGVNMQTATTTYNVYNNFISDLRAPAGTTTSGFNILGINGGNSGTMNIYYNTIKLGTAGTPVSGGTNFTVLGIGITGTSTSDIRNNIVNVNATTSGTGYAACVNVTTGTHVAGTPASAFGTGSNNNIYYINPGAANYLFVQGSQTVTPLKNGYALSGLTPDATNNIVNDPAFNTACGAYKTFMSGRETATFTEDNLVATTPAGAFAPVGTSYAENGAQAITTPAITKDFADVDRTPTNDIGALQFNGTGTDAVPPTITYTVAPSGNLVCVPVVTATITDAGSGVDNTSGNKPRLYFRKSTEATAFGTYPANNNSAFNGWKYVETTSTGSPYSFSFDFSLLNTPIASGDLISYFIAAQDLASTPNIGTKTAIITGGCPISVNFALGLSATATNNFTYVLPTVISTTASNSAICVSGSTVLSLTSTPSLTGVTYQWEQSATGANGSFTNVTGGTGGTTASYTSGTLTNTTYFRARIYCNGTELPASPSSVLMVAVNNPQITGTTPATRCGTGTVLLSATANAGSIITWYTAATGGLPVATGNSYTTPIINATTTYYAGPQTNGSPYSATFGTGTTVNGTSSYPAPYSVYFGGAKHQMIILASELTAQGLVAGSEVSALKMTVQAVGGSFTGSLASFQIDIANTSTSVASSTSFIGGLQTVYGPVTQSIPTTGLPQVITHTFTSPFTWDGTSNIVVQTSFSNNSSPGTTQWVQMPYSTTAGNLTNYYRVDASSATTVLAATSPSGASPNRPNMVLVAANNCVGPRTAVVATVNPAPALAISAATATTCDNTSTTVTLSSPIGNFDNYVWTPATGVTGNATIGWTFNPTTSTTYTLSATQSGGAQCANEVAFNITVNASPAAPVVSPLTALVCGTGPQTLTATASVAPVSLLNESFQSFTGTAPSNGWVYNSSSTGGDPTASNWRVRGNNYAYGYFDYYSYDYYDFTFVNTGEGKFMLSNSAEQYGTTTRTTLTSPSFSTLNYPSASLKFKHNYNKNGTSDVAAVEISLDNSTWTALKTYTTSQGGFDLYYYSDFDQEYYYDVTFAGDSINIPSAYLDKPNVYIRYRYSANDGWWWAVDKVQVTAYPTATISWTATPALGSGLPTAAGTPSSANTSIVVNPSEGTYTYTATANSANGCMKGTSTTLTFGPDKWVGVDNNWFNAANWCGGIPKITTNVIIPAGLSNYPVLSTLTDTARVRNIDIAAGASVSVTGTGILNIGGAISNAGTFDVTDGTINLAGNAQTIGGSQIVNGSIKNLIMQGNSSILTGATNMLSVTGKVSFIGNNHTLVTNDNLTLISRSTGTGSIGDLSNNNVGIANDVTGNVTVERHIPSGRKWRFLSVPSATMQTVKQSWMEGSLAANDNQKPGYGMIVTDFNPSWSANGFDSQSPGGPTIKTFNSATGIYSGIPNTNSLLNTKNAYMVFVRGDRASLPANSITNATILRTYGPIKKYGITNSINAGEFTPIGNPYPSSVDLRKLDTLGMQGFVYLWDPKATGSYGLGNFQTLYRDGAGNWVTTNAGGSYGAAGSIVNSIALGQAFFVRGTTGNGHINFNEPAKTAGPDNVFFTAGNPEFIRAGLLRENVEMDAVRLDYGQTNSSLVDFNDARKMANTGENIAINNQQEMLVIERRTTVFESDTIRLNMTGMKYATYNWNILASNMDAPGRAGFFIDKFLNTVTVLNLADSNHFSFTINSTAGSYAPDRFMIVFKQQAQGPLPVTLTRIAANRNADQKTITVNWKTEQEISIDHYEIERSANGNNFVSIGQAAPRMNNGGAYNYSFIDNEPLSGDNFYRIKAVSVDGRRQVSNIAKVDAIKMISMISVYPNPVTDRMMKIRFQNQEAGDYRLELTNKAGQVMYTGVVNVNGNLVVKTVSLNKVVAQGAYQLRIIDAAGKVNVVQLFVE